MAELITPGRATSMGILPFFTCLLEAGHVRVTWGPKENRFRPAMRWPLPLSHLCVLAAGDCA